VAEAVVEAEVGPEVEGAVAVVVEEGEGA